MSFDDEDANRAFKQKFSFNFPLLCDTDREMGIAYGACDTPTDGFARRVGVVIDGEGLIKEYQASVDAARYPSEVLARL